MATLEREQIIGLVLDLYAARPEAKEYLDFWVSGDIDTKMGKAKALINKELSRCSRGRAKPRITKIRRYIKDITSLNPDSQAIVEVMSHAVCGMAKTGSNAWIKESTQRSAARLLHETLLYAREHGELNGTAARFRKAVEEMDGSVWFSRDFATMLLDELNDTLAAILPPVPPGQDPY